MARNYDTRNVDHDGLAPAVLLDRGRDLGDRLFRDFERVAGVGLRPIDRSVMDLMGLL